MALEKYRLTDDIEERQERLNALLNPEQQGDVGEMACEHLSDSISSQMEETLSETVINDSVEHSVNDIQFADSLSLEHDLVVPELMQEGFVAAPTTSDTPVLPEPNNDHQSVQESDKPKLMQSTVNLEPLSSLAGLVSTIQAAVASQVIQNKEL